jgi:hypothetical protein
VRARHPVQSQWSSAEQIEEQRPGRDVRRGLYAKPKRGYSRNHDAPERAIWPLAMSILRDKVHSKSRI